ncbi:hypothetical protein F0562_028112 [Nyssa sinensis]|uniref:Uncharacterized protein n=1 Tax=Nyssa sinensis TaxID=561372 RepID=A0A5J5B9S8_9ASTE|nr:hypothetical protein F0562_028112 [Nyssa sinensis]
MVWPLERWPSSQGSWKMRAAQRAGTRTRWPLPFTGVCRSDLGEDEQRLGVTRSGWVLTILTTLINLGRWSVNQRHVDVFGSSDYPEATQWGFGGDGSELTRWNAVEVLSRLEIIEVDGKLATTEKKIEKEVSGRMAPREDELE